jgi:photosystem II stability/assembly factor-like uncharacterized protein
VPTGFVPESFTAVSPSQWWVLGHVPCGSRLCPLIVTTTDAGAAFRALPTPGGPYSARPGTPISDGSVVFADADDGWAAGSHLYATHDGGEHWVAVSLPEVMQLVAGVDEVFAVVAPEPLCTTTPSKCQAPQPWRTSPASDHWTLDRAAGSVSTGLAVLGRSVWVIKGQGPAIGDRLLYSTDDGNHFVVEPQQVTGIVCDYQPVSESVIWAYCSGGHFMWLYRSTDAGAQFITPTEQSPGASAEGCPNGPSMAATSASTLVVACNVQAGSPLLRSTDGGTSWERVLFGSSGYWSPIGFTNSEVGYALWDDYSGGTPIVQLWRTADGRGSRLCRKGTHQLHLQQCGSGWIASINQP